jgi:cell division protein FtsW
MVGLLMVYSASTAYAFSKGDLDESTSLQFLYRQSAFIGAGFFAMLLAMRFDYHWLRGRLVLWPLMGVTLILLAAVLLVGDERRGGLRWLVIAGFTFQPSELAKLALVVMLAVKLAENQSQLRSFRRGFLPPMIITGAFAGLVLAENDLGTPTIMIAVALVMILLAGGHWLHVFGMCGPAAAGVIAMIVTTPYRVERILAFLQPWRYRGGAGLQLIESLTGFARGGLWGKGLGAGEQKLNYLPYAYSDFIFAVWAEEMGLVGTLALIGLFALLLFIGIRIALCARDLFGTLLAGGIVSLIAVEAAFNMAVTIGLLPTKGLALPFISAGGSALVINFILVGILVNIGTQAVEPVRAGRLAHAA